MLRRVAERVRALALRIRNGVANIPTREHLGLLLDDSEKVGETLGMRRQECNVMCGRRKKRRQLVNALKNLGDEILVVLGVEGEGGFCLGRRGQIASARVGLEAAGVAAGIAAVRQVNGDRLDGHLFRETAVENRALVADESDVLFGILGVDANPLATLGQRDGLALERDGEDEAEIRDFFLGEHGGQNLADRAGVLADLGKLLLMVENDAFEVSEAGIKEIIGRCDLDGISGKEQLLLLLLLRILLLLLLNIIVIIIILKFTLTLLRLRFRKRKLRRES